MQRYTITDRFYGKCAFTAQNDEAAIEIVWTRIRNLSLDPADCVLMRNDLSFVEHDPVRGLTVAPKE